MQFETEKVAPQSEDKALKPKHASKREEAYTLKVISGPASRELAEAVSAQTGFPNVPVVSKIFPDGESYVRLDGSVQGEDVAIVQTTCPPMQDGRLFQLAFLADSARRAGAKKSPQLYPIWRMRGRTKLF